MTLLRPLSGLILALVLAVTSVTMAVARQYDPMGRAVVICADGGLQTIVLDAQGKPIPMSHPCPDCVAGMAAQIVPTLDALLLRPGFAAQVLLPDLALDMALPLALPPSARGPPSLM